MNPFICRGLRCALVLAVVAVPGFGATLLRADGLKSAQVSRLYNDVKLLPENQQPRPAAVADVVTGKAAVQTGGGSRAELVFTDKTLTRLGANTFFSFENGTRNLDLGKGTMLLEVPKNAGGAQIHTAAVTAAITGTTLLVEYNPKSYSKIIVLEGTVRAFLRGRVGESILLHAGEMLITPPDAKKLPEAVHVDLGVLYSTSGLLDDRAFGALPSDRLVSAEIDHQKGDVAKGKLKSSNLYIAGQGTQVQIGNISYVGATNTRITAQQGRDSAINLDHPGASTPRVTPTPTAPPINPSPTPVTTPPGSPTPIPASPTPASPTPASPTPASPTPASPTPASPTPASPTPASPTPASPTPASPTPASPTPASPTPASPTPASPTPASPTPASPTPASPTPASPTPASPTPASPTPASPTPASPTPASPTPASPTPASPTPASPTPASPTPASPTPASPTPASPTPASPTPASPTPASPTPASPTPASPTPASPTPASPTPPVTPTPGKTGPLTTIAGNDANNPSLYNIDGTTTILTDPYITTQGVTSYGKIYRGSEAGDGAPSSYLLGASTPSSFDTQVGFDSQFNTGAQIGAFLFNSLAFTAAPASISVAGGPGSLALVGVNGISAAPASAFTINIGSLDQLLLATQNGSINLSNVTFTDSASGTSTGTSLTFYARGAANSLNLTSANLDVSGSLSLFGEGGLNFNAGSQALHVNTAILVSGADLSLGGTIEVYNGSAAAINATANGNLSIATSGVLNTTGALNLTSGGTFQSDGFAGTSANTLTITSTGDLTTTSNAQLNGDTVNLTTNGALTLGGTTLFANTLNASSVGALNINGVVGGGFTQAGAPLALGTATFGTSAGSVSVGGQITANTVNFNLSAGGYSTASSAVITANAVNISAPNGNISLSAAIYAPAGEGNEVLTVTGNTITVPDATFTPQANQIYHLTQNGPFTVPASDTYAFNSLTLNQAGDGPAGDLDLGASSTLTLNTATVSGSLNVADGATFNIGTATIAQTVTLTGAPTLNLNGLLTVNNSGGAADAFTATGAATINLGSAGAMGLTPTLSLPTGNFNGGSATINGYTGSAITVAAGNFTAGQVTLANLNVSGTVSTGGLLTVGQAGVGSATLTALSAQNLTSSGSVIVSGNVTPYNLTSGDSLSAALLEVGGSLSYAGTSNAGQLKLSVQSGFNLGAGAASASEEPESYATGMDFYGAPLSPTTDNAVAGNGGSLTINTGSANGTGDFTVGDFTGNGNSTYLSFNGGNLMSTAGNTGFGGNGGSFTVNSVGNVTVNPNVFFYGYGGDFINEATVTGTGTPTGGNGGTLSLTAAGTITINNPSEFDLYGGNVGDGGDNVATGNAGNGGTFSLNGAAGITINSGTGSQFTNIDVRGGGAEASGTSGNGGTISLVSAAGPITVGPGAHLATDGGAVAGASGTAGSGGMVTVQAAGDVALGDTSFESGGGGTSAVKRPEASATSAQNSSMFLTADGGTADQTGLVGGNGGKITISSASTDSSQPVIAIGTALISATTGGNSMTAFGGTGGTINITASGVPAASPGGTPSGQYQIALDNTAVVASDDNTVTANTPNSHSQVGGTINVTSASTTGLGILIQDNSNLVALVNAASTGAGGKINVLSSGGEIDVYDSSLTASGTGSLVQLSTQQPTSDGTATSINLGGATLSADTVTLSTAGPDDEITVSSSQLSAASLTLAARGGSGSTVDVMASSMLSGVNSLTLQGANIQVNDSTLITSGNGSALSLGGAGATGSGANILVSSGILEANGTGGRLTLTGAPSTASDAADITVNGVSDLEANGAGNVLLLTTAGTTGTGIMISSGSMLSSTFTTNGTVTGGTIELTTAGATIDVDDSTLTASGTNSAISLTSTGAGANIKVTGGSSLTLGSTGFPGAISLTSTGSAANITVGGSTLMTAGSGGGSINLMSTGTASTLNVTGGSTVAGDASVSLAGTTIKVTGSTVSADSSSGTVTLDTTDATQDGVVNIAVPSASPSPVTVSAGTVNVTARGTNGAIMVGGVSSSELATLSASNGNLTLQTPGDNGSITISPDSTLTASSTLNLLAPGTTGLITIGAAGTSSMDAPSLSADTLKIRAMGAGGGIFINANSTLSATTQLLLYADGSNGSITFQGGGTITLNTGSMAGILAAPTITIKTGTFVNVTNNSNTPLQVYTNTANYSSDDSGNNSQTGVFEGSAQPSGHQQFNLAPAFPGGTGNAMKVATNAGVSTTAAGSVPMVNTPKGSKANTVAAAGTVIRPTLMRAAGPSIPFSALNPQDLSYDTRLVQGGPKTVAVANKRGKAGTRLPAGDVAAGRAKLRAATERTEAAPRKPDATALPSAFRPSR